MTHVSTRPNAPKRSPARLARRAASVGAAIAFIVVLAFGISTALVLTFPSLAGPAGDVHAVAFNAIASPPEPGPPTPSE